VTQVGETRTKAVLWSEAGDGDMHGLSGEEFLGTRSNFESPATLFQPVDFAGRVNLGRGGRPLREILLSSS